MTKSKVFLYKIYLFESQSDRMINKRSSAFLGTLEELWIRHGAAGTLAPILVASNTGGTLILFHSTYPYIRTSMPQGHGCHCGLYGLSKVLASLLPI